MPKAGSCVFFFWGGGDNRGLIEPFKAVVQTREGRGLNKFTARCQQKLNIDLEGDHSMSWDSSTALTAMAVYLESGREGLIVKNHSEAGC